MLIRIFKPLRSESDTFAGNRIGDIKLTSGYSYTEPFGDIGTFELTMPIDIPHMEELEENMLLCVDNRDWLMVKEIEEHEETGTCSISGTDLRGMLQDRITLYDDENAPVGTKGYDVILGSSETVIKHYVNNNLVNPEDSNRKIHGLVIATDQQRGEPNDKYMSRFEYVSDIAKKVCEETELGYQITVDLENNTMIFDVVEGLNRTHEQSERNRVVFSVDRRNVNTLKRLRSIKNDKNTIYATKGGTTSDDNTLTVMVAKEETVPTGIDRREVQINVSTDNVADMPDYALKNAQQYEKVDSFSADVTAKGFGDQYHLGDFVSIKKIRRNWLTRKEISTIVTKQITEVRRIDDRIQLTLGKPQTKAIKRLEDKLKGV